MTTRTNAPDQFDKPPIPVQAKIAGAWTSFMFLVIYVDYFHLYKPGFVADLLAGTVFEFNIGPTFMSFALTLIAIPSMMVMLSLVLPARVNRTTNLVVAAIYIPVSVFNAAGGTWAYAYFFGLSIGLEVLLLGFILRWAWTWPRRVVKDSCVTPQSRLSGSSWTSS